MLNLILLPFVIIISIITAFIYGIGMYIRFFKIVFKEILIKKKITKY